MGMKKEICSTTIEVAYGDITKEEADAIVNAANKGLLGGRGVDGAIHRAGGPAILAESSRLGGCETGDAKITTAGELPAGKVIHTVGPVYRDGQHGEADLLASCFRRSLEVAAENGCKTIAFPAISCGAYGYPIPAAASIALRTVAAYVSENEGVDLVRFVLFSPEALTLFEKALQDI
jgi:O-acetyl-ADP-ribose deacetylase